ncbi:MAG: hypothetical protein NC401_18335 [Ruminococcus sp.]|nr:hypothetical protein [Ruminococcus sp.]
MTLQEKSGIFYIESGGSLTLCDCKRTGKLTGVTSDASTSYRQNSPVTVNGGTFNMYNGSISGNETRCGGGVYVENGTFNLFGGSVSNNTVYDYATNNMCYGGGVYIRNNSTFNMYGGDVSNNRATRTTKENPGSSTCGSGGGIYIDGSTFVMSGGTISQNFGEVAAGGIYLYNSTANMTGGSITGNQTEWISGRGGGNGGGVTINSGSAFTMSGGTISNNKAIEGVGGGIYGNYGTCIIEGGTISGNEASSAGGIQACGNFIMTGGSITGNIADSGGGLYHYATNSAYKVILDGKVNISGNKTPAGADSNMYLSKSKEHMVFTIGENFDTDLPIGISIYKSYVPNDCTKSVALTSSVSDEIFKKFKSEQSSDSGVNFVHTSDGVIRFEKPHTYSTPTEWKKDEINHWQECSVCQAKADETAHTWKEETKAATCTEKGEKKSACEVCGQTKTEDIAATGHTLTETKAKAATCTEKGNTAYWYCSACRKYFSDSAGKTETTLDKTVIAAKGHTEVTDAAKAPTCTETGLTEGKHCSVCDTVITAQTTVAATGHDWDDGVVTTPATEDSEGVKTFTCANCKETRTETTPKLDHVHSLIHHEKVNADCVNTGTVEYWHCEKCGNDYGDDAGTNQLADLTIPAKGHTEETDAAAAVTCTTDGKTEGSHCSVCGTVIKAQTIVPKTGHAWNDGVVTVEPTEDSDGVKTFTCSKCNETRTETIPSLNHVHTLTHHAKVDADCLNAGTVEYWSCSVCGKNYSDEAAKNQLVDLTIAAKGHTEVKDAAVAATCTVDGKTEGSHCSVCNTVIKAQTTVPKTGHVWDNGVITKAPTASAEGVKTYTCTVCGATKTEKIPATGGTGTPNTPTNPDNPNNNENGNIITEVEPGENVPPTELKTPKDELIDAVLTPEEKVQIEDGVDIKIILKVEDGTAKVPAEDKGTVEEAIDNMTDYKLGQYLDVELLKIIGNTQEKISETSTEITVTFDLPDALRGEGRVYSVIRVHEGVTTVLPDIDDDDNTVTIKTDKFSTYALAYSENIAPDDNNPVDDTPSEDDNSDTTLDGGEPTSSDTSDTSDTSSDNSEPVNNSTSDNTSSGENSDDNGGNPATGIAVSCLPMAMAVIALTVAATRKKK